MGDKIVLLLLLLICLTFEIVIMLGIACSLSNGRIFFATIGMFGLHYYVVIASKTFERLIN